MPQDIPTPPPQLTLIALRLPGRDGLHDMTITDGRITAIAPTGAVPRGPVLDAGGRLAIPPLVDAHIHLDKTLWGMPFRPHVAGNSVAERIASETRMRQDMTVPVETRGAALLRHLLGLGTLAVRSHADIDPQEKLKGLEAELALKAQFAGLVDIQIVAFPQSGLMRAPGTVALMEDAARNGADLIGGLDPAGIDGDVTGHLDTIFAMADRHGLGLDIHLHDGGELGGFELRQIAERTQALGLQGKVTVSHAFALGALPPAVFDLTAGLLARAGISIITSAPGRVPMPPVAALRAAGVTVIAANDNIRDAWSPFGNGDLLERAALVCARQDFRLDADLSHALDMVSTLPAALLGRPPADLSPGSLADMVLLPVASRAEAVAARPLDRLVLRAGRVVAQGGRLAEGLA